MNELDATRPLPKAFTGAGETRMACVEACLGGIEERSWLHHIQRLMVLGNLSLLAGIRPQEVTAWMWERFVDGAEWVMVPNVIEMSLYADGGRMATKPYAAGGAYLSRMSTYCKSCSFDPKKRVGEDAVRSPRCTGTSSSATQIGSKATTAWCARYELQSG